MPRAYIYKVENRWNKTDTALILDLNGMVYQFALPQRYHSILTTIDSTQQAFQMFLDPDNKR